MKTALFAALCGSLLVGCAPPTSPTPLAELKAPVELRTWKLPRNQSGQLAGALNNAFKPEGASSHATVGPNGSLLVVGPAEMLASVDAYVGQLEAAPEVAERNISLQYWVVRGEPADTITLGAGLGAMEAILTELSGTDGPQRYTLTAAQTLRSRDGERASFETEAFRGHQQASIQDDGAVSASISLEIPGAAETDTRLMIQAGQTLALSQSVALEDGAPVTLYTLVRASIR